MTGYWDLSQADQLAAIAAAKRASVARRLERSTSGFTASAPVGVSAWADSPSSHPGKPPTVRNGPISNRTKLPTVATMATVPGGGKLSRLQARAFGMEALRPGPGWAEHRRRILGPGRLANQFAVAVHEAGHATVGALLGARLQTAWVAGECPADLDQLDGKTTFAEFGILAESKRHVVAAAGGVAQAVLQHGPNPTVAQISPFIHGSPIDGPEVTRFAIARGTERVPKADTLPLVLACWPAICALAGKITDSPDLGEITHDDVTAALGLSADPALHPFELANLRAGLREVPTPVRPRQAPK